jgi:hypothetical protein
MAKRVLNSHHHWLTIVSSFIAARELLIFTLHVLRVGCTISQHTRFDVGETERSRRRRLTTNDSSEIRHRKALLDTTEFHENIFAGIAEEAMMPLDRRRRVLAGRASTRMQVGGVLISLLSPAAECHPASTESSIL